MSDMIDSTKESIEWIKPIKGYEQYWITNNGMVWSRKRNIWKKLRLSDDEHLTVQMTNEHGSDDFLVHRLVYQTFVGPIPKGFIVHHLDECSVNNLYTNLRAMSRAEHLKLHNEGKTMSQQAKEKAKATKMKNGTWGKKHSEITKQIMRKPKSEITKQKMSEAAKKRIKDPHTGRFMKNI